jgi:hypothetical protein
VLRAEHIQGWDACGLGGALGELGRRVDHQRDVVEERLHRRRDGEEALDESSLLLEGGRGRVCRICNAIFRESGRHEWWRWRMGCNDMQLRVGVGIEAGDGLELVVDLW